VTARPLKLHLRSLAFDPDNWRDAHPYNVPAVEFIRENGLRFTRPITFFVGENGAGKTTVLESVAVRYSRIGASTPYLRRTGVELSMEDAPLGWNARLSTHPDASPEGFFLRASTLASLLSDLDGGDLPRARRAERSDSRRYGQRSHGEGLLNVLNQHFDSSGFYLMDEPETALSFQSQLAVVGLLHHLAVRGAQAIVATHSPIVLSLPNAQILEFGTWGVRETSADDLDLLRDWRSFLNGPERWLRGLLE
jgi:predicted ATPase